MRCERGASTRLLCEGGPSLFGSLLAADLVDELCLTIAPQLNSGDARRIVDGAPESPRAMRLIEVLASGQRVAPALPAHASRRLTRTPPITSATMTQPNSTSSACQESRVITSAADAAAEPAPPPRFGASDSAAAPG